MNTEQKLNILRSKWRTESPRIMILGLGSVGNYLLDYLVTNIDDPLEIAVVGRNDQKINSDVNITKVAAIIRHRFNSNIKIFSKVNFDYPEQISECIKNFCPDIIINSSRAYSGVKYGNISWKNVRAYGIWSPLSIKYVKNLMQACDLAESNAIVINTSYSDSTIAWLKSAGKSYPDFGSGNLNHLIPRLKMAIGELNSIQDYWNIDVTIATSHFHDVVISKEGQDEGIPQLIVAEYNGSVLEYDIKKALSKCSITMPVDAKRNMMNASSNFEIIKAIFDAVKNGKKVKFHSPGAFGEIGGYPVIIDGTTDRITTYIDEQFWSIDEMRKKNRESIYLDGIEDIRNGCLIYTDELVKRTKSSLGFNLSKTIEFSKIEETAKQIIKEIIEKQLNN